MSFYNPNNVLEESLLLFYITGILGLRVVGPYKKRWFSYFHATFLTILLISLFFITRSWMWNHYDTLHDVIYYFKGQKLRSILNLIFIPVLMFTNISKSFEDIVAYKKLDQIDTVLSYLNFPIDHQTQADKEVGYLFIYASVTSLINFFTYFSIASAVCGYIFNISWFIDQLPIFFGIMTLLGYDISVEKIRSRFEKINAVIKELLGPKKISVIQVQTTDINNALKLRLARRIHLQLHDAASAINKAYRSRLFVVFLTTMISVFNHLSCALDLVGNELAILDIILHLIWICFHFMKYFHIANSCRYATLEAKLAAGYFFESRGPEGLNDEVKAFCQQLINRQLELNGWTIFSIDLPKGLMICIAILTISYFSLL